MGWEYIGPVDGHDLPTLLEHLPQCARASWSGLRSCDHGEKGRRYDSAEEDARKWHGVAPFDLDSPGVAVVAGPVTYTQAFGESAIECAEMEPRLVAITAAMPDGTGLTKFSQKFPERYYDVGIAEQHAVTFAAGLAAGGMVPFYAIYSTFLQRGFDQVLHDVAIQNLPVRFFLDRAGLVGDDGPTHHGVFDLSYLTPIPNMVLLSPRDTTELREMTHWMCGYSGHPTAVRYPRGSSDDMLPEARTPIQLGRAEWLRRSERPRIALCALGSMVSVAMRAADQLAKDGIETDVLNLRFVKPLDEAAVREAASRCGSMIVIEENVLPGGVGDRIRAISSPAARLRSASNRSASLTHFIEHGPQPVIRAENGLGVESVVRAAHGLVGNRQDSFEVASSPRLDLLGGSEQNRRGL